MDEWYYSLDGTEKVGPISLAELKSMFQSGELKSSTLVLGPNFKEWVPAKKFRALVPQASGQLSEGLPNSNLDSGSFHTKGLAHGKANEHKQAIEDYDKAIQLNPNNPVIYNDRGDSHLALNNHENALADYNQAIALNPNYDSAYINRSKCHLKNKNYAKSIADCDSAIRINSKNPVAYFNRGLIHLLKLDYIKGITDNSEAVLLNPDYDSAYNNRGYCHFKCQNYTQAIADFDKAIELNPNNAMTYFNRGSAYEALGKPTSALTDYEKALEINPDFKDAKYSQVLLLETTKLNGEHTKYPAINLYINLCTFIAIVIAFISAIVLIVFITISSNEKNPAALGFGLAVLIFGTISCISILAFSQLLKLLVDIESNQRSIIDKLK